MIRNLMKIFSEFPRKFEEFSRIFSIFSSHFVFRILVMGIPEDCCPKVTAKIHVDQFIASFAENCHRLERLEIRWDLDTLRFSDKSSKFIDILRMRCLKLHTITLCDGRYFELVKSNFERSNRRTVVRTTSNYKTTCAPLLQNYKDLLFN